MWLLEYLRLQTWLAFRLSGTALVYNITLFFLGFNFQGGDCRKYSYFIFVNHLLCPAIFHVHLGTRKSYYYSTIEYYTVQVQCNSDGPADFSAGGMPRLGRSVKMSRVLEGLVRGIMRKFRDPHIWPELLLLKASWEYQTIPENHAWRLVLQLWHLVTS